MDVKIITLLSAVKSSFGMFTSRILVWVHLILRMTSCPCVILLFLQSGDGTRTSCMLGKYITSELCTPGPLPDHLKL